MDNNSRSTVPPENNSYTFFSIIKIWCVLLLYITLYFLLATLCCLLLTLLPIQNDGTWLFFVMVVGVVLAIIWAVTIFILCTYLLFSKRALVTAFSDIYLSLKRAFRLGIILVGGLLLLQFGPTIISGVLKLLN